MRLQVVKIGRNGGVFREENIAIFLRQLAVAGCINVSLANLCEGKTVTERCGLFRSRINDCSYKQHQLSAVRLASDTTEVALSSVHCQIILILAQAG